MPKTFFGTAISLTVLACLAISGASAQEPAPPPEEANVRAAAWVGALTLAEKIDLVTGLVGTEYQGKPRPDGSLGSAGYVPGVPRLGIPAQQLTDAGLGVTNPAITLDLRSRPGDGATALPSAMAIAASWDGDLAAKSGAVMGAEARAKGFNILLAGSINLVREPLGGRNFEYPGEDPLLAGLTAGAMIRGVQSQSIVSTIKHYALNAQETGRFIYDARISEAALRESDLLAFEIGMETGRPGAVMCAYNMLNGNHACENDQLLNRILKGDLGFRGYVMSDWGAVHSTAKAANAGLDQESAREFDSRTFFGEALAKAVSSGEVSQRRLDDMVQRILRSLIASGAADSPPIPGPIDYAAHGQTVRKAAAAGIVLLKNDGALLPISDKARNILVIGGHADRGVFSGGGSSQVTPPQGYGLIVSPEGLSSDKAVWQSSFYLAPAPLGAIRAAAPGRTVTFLDGKDVEAATKAARSADMVIVFAGQPSSEGADLQSLSLSGHQDDLIAAVGKSNRRTVVVLQTAGPIAMPWLDHASAVLEAWYPGSSGADAIADILFGRENPRGRLPVTFPASMEQTPRPVMAAPPASGTETYPIDYVEGADVGYRWQARNGYRPLFPFGYGLSYTRFAYRDLHVTGGATVQATAFVTNTGKRTGTEVVQFYAVPENGLWPKRLIGWATVTLQAGETRQVSMKADPRLLARYDTKTRQWKIAGGSYRVSASRHADDLTLSSVIELDDRSFAGS